MHFNPLFENSVSTFLFYLFCTAVFIQLLYVLLIYSRFAFYKKKTEKYFDKPVSVVICCRNEQDNLMNNLQTIVEQDYPNFEVVVVNHMSSDDSVYILEAFQVHYPHMRVVNVQRSSHLSFGKKFPLSIGVKAAKNDFLILTDADCKPISKDWLKNIVTNFEKPGNEIVIGYGPMNRKKGFLNWFIRFETAYIAVNYFSYALSKIPYMSVGRNFAYTKELFVQNKGFKNHYAVISGDDDLFLQEVATRKNVSIEIDESTWCYSDAKETWKEWINQKRRHYTASSHYKFIKKVLLGSYNITWLLTLVLFVILLFDVEYRGLSLVVFGFLLMLKWTFFALGFSKLKSMKMALIFPVWETIYMLVTPLVFFSANKTSSQRWN